MNARQLDEYVDISYLKDEVFHCVYKPVQILLHKQNCAIVRTIGLLFWCSIKFITYATTIEAMHEYDIYLSYIRECDQKKQREGNHDGAVGTCCHCYDMWI